jgi:NADP-dependent 3-hydroxy acid dehydrogenase YdfG
MTGFIGATPCSFDTLYASCKAGVDLTIKSIAKLVPSNSCLIAVSPGIIAGAGMTLARTDHDTLATKCGLTPTKHFTTSKDVAGLVYYILFESENININGGIFIT